MKTTQTGCASGQWYNGCGIVDAEVSGSNDDFGISLMGNSIGFGIGNGDVTATAYRQVNDGAWHHVAVTWSSVTGAMKIYIDGNLDGSATGAVNPRIAPSTLRIGKGQTYSGYIGAIDELRIYKIGRAHV